MDDAGWAVGCAMLGPMDSPAPLNFSCPRCERSVTEPFYGPCADCRAELRATLGSDARTDVEAAAYEPKMNVTPNAVAVKD